MKEEISCYWDGKYIYFGSGGDGGVRAYTLKETTEWSSEKPTEEGYYWFWGTIKEEGSPASMEGEKVRRLVHIHSFDELSITLIGTDCSFDLEEFDGLWMPTEEPEVP